MKHRSRYSKFRSRAARLIAVLIVFFTTYSLIVPALTLDDDAASGEAGLSYTSVDTTSETDGASADGSGSDTTSGPLTAVIITGDDSLYSTTGVDAQAAETADITDDETAETVTSDVAETEEAEGTDGTTEETNAEISGGSAESSLDTSESTEPAEEGQDTESQETEAAENETAEDKDEKDKDESDKESLNRTLSYKGEDYTVTVTLNPQEEILKNITGEVTEEGTEESTEEGVEDDTEKGTEEVELKLTVREIAREAERQDYIAAAKEAMGLPEEAEFAEARFFDITILVNGEEYEPVYPAAVTITYQDAIRTEEHQEVSVVHFVEEDEVEIIDDITLSEDNTEVAYEQEGFSVVGVLVGTGTNNNNWPAEAGNYAMVVKSGNQYYIIDHDFNAVPVTYENGTITTSEEISTDTQDDYIWYLNAVNNGAAYQQNCYIQNPESNQYLSFTENGAEYSNNPVGLLWPAWNGANQRYLYANNQTRGTGTQGGDRYAALNNGILTSTGAIGNNNNVEVYFAQMDVTLNLYPCEYNNITLDGKTRLNDGEGPNNYQHYLPVTEEITVDVPMGDIITETVNGVTYYKIPIEYFDELKAYGYDPDSSKCPFVNGIEVNTFKNEVVKNWSTGWNLEGGNSPYADSYETINGVKYVVLRENNGDDTNNKKDWKSVYYAMLTVATDIVNPASTIINIFDYWTTGRDDDDAFTDSIGGINTGHALHFFFDAGAVNTGGGTYNNGAQANNNTSSNPGGVMQGIVANILGADGYPVLSGSNVVGGSTESLAYLFSPENGTGKQAYTNVTGLLSINADGYYWYDGAYRGVEYDETTNSLIEYTTPVAVAGGGSPYGQFFPFENAHQLAVQSNLGRGIQHYFGMTMTTRFSQVYGGHTDSTRKEEVVYNFTGDDDMWIFIDGVLVADLGGCHSAESLSINFSTGVITIKCPEGSNYRGVYDPAQQVYTTTIKAMFEAAGVAGNYLWNGNTFADDTFHTLKMFYMERGNWDSTLSLSFNLVEYTPTSVYKLNQYGQPVAGATFEVYRSDSTYSEEVGPVYTGTTNEFGELMFVDSEGSFYSQPELEQIFGTYFILRETGTPNGYQKVDDIHLYFSNKSIVCANTMETGSYASNHVLTTATNTLKLVNGNTVSYYTTGDSGSVYGTLFAVPLKKNGAGTDLDAWTAMYGSPVEGYSSTGTGLAAAIEAAKQQAFIDQDIIFKYKSGVMQGAVQNLPGSIEDYVQFKYAALGYAAAVRDSEYAIGYFWTSAEAISAADTSNTWRVDGNETWFDSVWGATIRVPNYNNVLYYQKQDKDGNYLNGATFALYQSGQENGSFYYLATDGTKIYLDPDENLDNQGTAHIGSPTAVAVDYTVNDNGSITVGDYTISPYRTGTTMDFVDNRNNAEDDHTLQTGTNSFVGLEGGYYLLREVDVPSGYLLNPAVSAIYVDADNVYAHAGTADDGVTVALGPGFLSPTLTDYAMKGVDETLYWITTKLQVTETDPANANAFTGSIDEKNLIYDETQSEYSKYDYKSVVDGEKAVRLYTDTGWSNLEIYQNYQRGNASANAKYEDAQNIELSNGFGKTTYVIVRDEQIYDVELIKLDQSGSVLTGATLSIQRTNKEVLQPEEIQAVKVEGDKILIRNEILLNTVYVLSEAEAPDGYNLLTETYSFKIVPDSSTASGYKLVKADGSAWDADAKLQMTVTTHYDEDLHSQVPLLQLKVTNTTGYELPSTGGRGANAFLLVGLGLILFSLLGFCLLKEKAEE